MLIRKATAADATQLSTLIEPMARRFCFNPGQIVPAWFLATLTPAALADLLNSTGVSSWVAEIGQELAGVITISNASHIHHFS